MGELPYIGTDRAIGRPSLTPHRVASEATLCGVAGRSRSIGQFEPELERPKCELPECEDAATHTGRCLHHEHVRKLNTSDGRHTGGRRKLTDEQVLEAFRMRSAFKSTGEIASHFGITRSSLANYFRRPRPVLPPTEEN